MSTKGIILAIIFIVGLVAFIYNINHLFAMYDAKNKADDKYNAEMNRLDEIERGYCINDPNYAELFPTNCKKLLG